MKLPEKTRHSYKKTFLKNVQVLFNFPCVEDFNAKVELAKTFFTGHDYEAEPMSEQGSITVKKGSIKINLQNGLLTIIQDAVNYNGFDGFKNECESIINMLSSLGVVEFEALIIQKVNVYVFSKSRYPHGIDSNAVSYTLYSDDFRAQGVSYTAGDYDSITVLAQRKFVELEQKYTATLTLTGMSQQIVPIANASACLEDINKELYNMFIWATSENLRNLMDKED